MLTEKLSLKKYFYWHPLVIVKVNENSPWVLKYIVAIENHIRRSIWGERSKGKIDNIQIFIPEVTRTIPSVLKYLVIIENHIRWFIFKQRCKGKIGNIRNYKNIHNGKRCFIIANGPSVNKTNFSLIKNEISFGTSRLFKAKKDLKINYTYYVISSRFLVQTCYDDFCNINKTIFLGQHAAEMYGQMLMAGRGNLKRKPVPTRWTRRFMWEGKEMSTDIEKGSADGATVVTECLQLAYYMGFKKVYLLGCDCDFSEQGHFFDESPESYEDSASDIPRWIESYKMCKKAFEDDGREIINATVSGKLEVFKRQSLEKIMKNEKND